MADGLAAAAGVCKGCWKLEEDQVLIDYISVNGEGSWNYVARATGLHRTGRSCRQRWRNYLRPGLLCGKMTAEEQEAVVKLQSQWGNSWSKIANQLPGRTEKQVIKFWKTSIQQQQKKRLRQHDKVDITAAGSWSSIVNNDRTPATTEGQAGSSISINNSGSSVTTGVDQVIVPQQQPSMCQQLGDHQQVPGGAAEGTPGGACAAAMDMDYLFFQELLAASEKYLDFWCTLPS